MTGMDNVINFLMEKLKEALLMVLNFVGQPLIWLKNFGWQVLLSLQNLFVKIVSWFDEVFPPETRVEKIKYWFHLALPYLIIALALSLVICCCYFCSGLLFTVMNLIKTACVGLIKIVIKIIISIFNAMRSLLKTVWDTLIQIIRSVFNVMRSLLKTVWDTLIQITRSVFTCCRASSEPVVKMMKAPGRAGVWIARTAFESSPQSYFAGLRAGDTLV